MNWTQLADAARPKTCRLNDFPHLPVIHTEPLKPRPKPGPPAGGSSLRLICRTRSANRSFGPRDTHSFPLPPRSSCQHTRPHRPSSRHPGPIPASSRSGLPPSRGPRPVPHPDADVAGPGRRLCFLPPHQPSPPETRRAPYLSLPRRSRGSCGKERGAQGEGGQRRQWAPTWRRPLRCSCDPAHRAHRRSAAWRQAEGAGPGRGDRRRSRFLPLLSTQRGRTWKIQSPNRDPQGYTVL